MPYSHKRDTLVDPFNRNTKPCSLRDDSLKLALDVSKELGNPLGLGDHQCEAIRWLISINLSLATPVFRVTPIAAYTAIVIDCGSKCGSIRWNGMRTAISGRT